MPQLAWGSSWALCLSEAPASPKISIPPHPHQPKASPTGARRTGQAQGFKKSKKGKPRMFPRVAQSLPVWMSQGPGGEAHWVAPTCHRRCPHPREAEGVDRGDRAVTTEAENEEVQPHTKVPSSHQKLQETRSRPSPGVWREPSAYGTAVQRSWCRIPASRAAGACISVFSSR